MAPDSTSGTRPREIPREFAIRRDDASGLVKSGASGRSVFGRRTSPGAAAPFGRPPPPRAAYSVPASYRSQAARRAACSSRATLGDLAGLPLLKSAPCSHREQMSTRGSDTVRNRVKVNRSGSLAVFTATRDVAGKRRSIACAHDEKMLTYKAQPRLDTGETMRRREFIALAGASVTSPFSALAHESGRTCLGALSTHCSTFYGTSFRRHSLSHGVPRKV